MNVALAILVAIGLVSIRASAVWLAYKMGAARNRHRSWGLWLGWIGVILVACLGHKQPRVKRDLESQRRLNELYARAAEASRKP
jgi:hypothetical protein